MDAWFHCENPYPFVAQDLLDGTDSVRASLPNKYCDPKVAAQLFEETLDEYLLCDELGLNITSSEHHAGINCLYGASPVVLGIVARQTRNIRLLSMGTLVTVRQDPVRVAEEYATADVISRGRLGTVSRSAAFYLRGSSPDNHMAALQRSPEATGKARCMMKLGNTATSPGCSDRLPIVKISRPPPLKAD